MRQSLRMLLLFWLLPLCLLGQKKKIDLDVIDHWPENKQSAVVNNSGQYLAWMDYGLQKLVLEDTGKTWSHIALNAAWIGFSNKGRSAVYSVHGDSVCITSLGTGETQFILQGQNARLLTISGKECLTYCKGKDSFFIRDLESEAEAIYAGIAQVIVQNETTVLYNAIQGGDSVSLYVLDLLSGEKKPIWSGSQSINYCLNKDGTKIAFNTGDTIWYYEKGMRSAAPIADPQSAGWDEDLKTPSALTFSADDRWLFFSLKSIVFIAPPKPGFPRLTVWNHKDKMLQSHQVFVDKRPANFTMVISLIGEFSTIRPVFQLEHDGERILNRPEMTAGDYVLIERRRGGTAEDYWNPMSMPSIVLINLLTHDTKVIHDSSAVFSALVFKLSPGGKFVVYFDNFHGPTSSFQWYSYEISTGVTRCLTKQLTVPFNVQHDDGGGDMLIGHYLPYGFIGWAGDEKFILVQDQFDVWRLNMQAGSGPENLTGGFGRKNKIQLKLANEDGLTHKWGVPDEIILLGYDIVTKNSGYFTIRTDRKDFTKLTMGPYAYKNIAKAPDAEVWVMVRETETHAPNTFWTHDWKRFQQISDYEPNQHYNWFSAELLKWKTFDGQQGEGILYKPENFDPGKKYPVILNYYEQKSNLLHDFFNPEYLQAEINIPYMINEGYLIFVPDIHYTIGFPGKSAYNFIVSGAEYLKQFPFVDAKHMGLQGHSFGGFQTDYVVAHSHMFAAAESSSGWADIIMRTFGLYLDGVSAQVTAEVARTRIGGSIWDRRDLYIENSSIFYADKITTPLLLMNNPDDDQVPYPEGIELFTALRRLQKPVWMLEYEHEGHVLIDKRDYVDYTIRTSQFFDHFLREAPATEWMTKGIPQSKKNTDLGYAHDYTGKCYENCPVCNKMH